MRFTHTRATESLEELAARVYKFKEKPSAAQTREAVRALRDANPFLRKLSEVPDETLVVVPAVEGAVPGRTTDSMEGTAATLLVDRLREAASLAVEQLTGDLDDVVAAARDSLKLLRSSEVRRLIRSNAEAKSLHRATEEAAKARVADAEALREYREQVAEQIESDLEELLGALSGAAQNAPE